MFFATLERLLLGVEGKGKIKEGWVFKKKEAAQTMESKIITRERRKEEDKTLNQLIFRNSIYYYPQFIM